MRCVEGCGGLGCRRMTCAAVIKFDAHHGGRRWSLRRTLEHDADIVWTIQSSSRPALLQLRNCCAPLLKYAYLIEHISGWCLFGPSTNFVTIAVSSASQSPISLALAPKIFRGEIVARIPLSEATSFTSNCRFGWDMQRHVCFLQG